MLRKRFVYLIVAAFLLGNFILIFIQYHAERNIANLIEGNQAVLNEFRLSNELRTLETDVVQVENKIRGTVTTNDTAYIEGLDQQMSRIQTDLAKLQKISDNDSSVTYIGHLDRLIRKKLDLSNEILRAFSAGGKSAAEQTIITQGKQLTDSILNLTHKTIDLRQSILSGVSEKIDTSVRKVQHSSTFLIIFVLVAAAVLFWYIINTLRTQTRLILQISESEKQLKSAVTVKENFLANMSHEIRTPMNAILGFTSLLQKKQLDGESQLYVQTIHRSGENLLSIVNEILDLSKIEAGMMRIEPIAFQPRQLALSAVRLLESRAREKGLDINLQVDDHVPQTLMGDAHRLTQIIVNLLGNAIKFTEEGKIDIRLLHEGFNESRIRLGIEIQDTGIGIEPQQLDSIFERFRQADDETTRRFGGTGLGLSIVKELVELQGGSIEVESRPGAGACFRVRIPYLPVALSKEKAENKMEDANSVSGHRILAVEDNEVNQTLLTHVFRQHGLKLELAKNGKEALEKLQENSFDLILMDIQMPEMNGYETARRIRDELRSDLPIIAMTAHALPGEREKCLAAGMNEYLPKPVQEAKLMEMISRFLDGPAKNSYRFINLDYLKEVSRGDLQYERTVTRQFINNLPLEWAQLQKARDENDRPRVRDLSHNLRTTISVMGLNPAADELLEQLSDEQSQKVHMAWNELDSLFQQALEESRNFLRSLDGQLS